MSTESLFFNPFRMISPRLNAEASRLTQMLESPPEEVTSLEEGLLVMTAKLIRLAGLVRKSLILANSATLDECAELAKNIHEEEEKLTGELVGLPMGKSRSVLKAVLLFPGRLERAGHFLESIVNVSKIKATEGLAFNDKENKELDELFGLFVEMLTNFRDALLTRNRILLETMMKQGQRLGEMTVEFSLAHEDRLIDCQCSPKISSLYLDILDSMKNAGYHIQIMSVSLLNLSRSQEGSGRN